MKFYYPLFLAFFYLHGLHSLSITPEEANQIGNKIWKNECGGKIEGLTSWNKGENFPSLGIGHFIWYSREKEERFEETFPSLIHFLKEKGAHIPSWLETAQHSPWKTKEEFDRNLQNDEMKELRKFLFKTKDLQAMFIALRLEKSFTQMIADLPSNEKEKITTVFNRLASAGQGLYALIDYLNFKGAGTSPKESYQGQGWGLLQVLQKISPSSENPIQDFVTSAKSILTERVKNAPPERNEQQWLKGWFNRLDTYL